MSIYVYAAAGGVRPRQQVRLLRARRRRRGGRAALGAGAAALRGLPPRLGARRGPAQE